MAQETSSPSRSAARMAVAEAMECSVSSRCSESRFTGTGRMRLPSFCSARRYSAARITLGGVGTPSAAARAAGCESPCASPWRIFSLSSAVSGRLKRVSSARSSFSAPKERCVTTPSASSSDTPPKAKSCAARTAKSAGSSSTRSAPQRSAASARVHLSRQAGSPRCTNAPDIAQTRKSAFVSFFARESWCA